MVRPPKHRICDRNAFLLRAFLARDDDDEPVHKADAPKLFLSITHHNDAKKLIIASYQISDLAVKTEVAGNTNDNLHQ
ncbi:hypothetical protein CJ200_01830 [Citrobacter freundii]|nr:hypothetical protein CJ200_01830 [Citrobacter freundii]